MIISSIFKISIPLILFAASNFALAKNDFAECSIVTGDIFPNMESSSGNLKTPLGNNNFLAKQMMRQITNQMPMGYIRFMVICA